MERVASAWSWRRVQAAIDAAIGPPSRPGPSEALDRLRSGLRGILPTLEDSRGVDVTGWGLPLLDAVDVVHASAERILRLASYADWSRRAAAVLSAPVARLAWSKRLMLEAWDRSDYRRVHHYQSDVIEQLRRLHAAAELLHTRRATDVSSRPG